MTERDVRTFSDIIARSAFVLACKCVGFAPPSVRADEIFILNEHSRVLDNLNDALINGSYRKRLRQIVRCARIARRYDAHVIGITREHDNRNSAVPIGSTGSHLAHERGA